MTGRFALLGSRAPLPAHTHALFRLETGDRLAFADQRHFGLMRLAREPELERTKELRRLAPEPFSDEFTPEYLVRIFARTRRTLKAVLLDQTRVNGLGNIYAAEALFLARIHPSAVASRLSRRRAARLHKAILQTLGEAIAHGSASDVDLENIDGSYFGGGDEGRWRVYDREGEPCPSCGARVRRIVNAGRSTYFCPRCQRS
jgi:formamidopyrimidine-DNA glycosylase